MEYFQRMVIFKGQHYEVLKQFYDVSEEISLSKNNVIYNIDDIPTHIYFIKKGEFSIQVTKNFNNTFTKIIESTPNTFTPIADPKDTKLNSILPINSNQQ